MQDTKLIKQLRIKSSTDKNRLLFGTYTIRELLSGFETEDGKSALDLLDAELSTYKQELIEWVEGKKTKVSPEQVASNIQRTYHKSIHHSSTKIEKMSKKATKAYWSVKSHNYVLDDLINHIKGEK